MCYEYSGWFEKVRAKQLRKAQQDIDALNKKAAPAPAVKEAQESKPAEEREKVPA